MNFTGTALTLIATKTSSYGAIWWALDGGVPVLVDLSSLTPLYQQQAWSTGPLANGPHTVVVSWSGVKSSIATGTYINIDVVDVTGSLRTLGTLGIGGQTL